MTTTTPPARALCALLLPLLAGCASGGGEPHREVIAPEGTRIEGLPFAPAVRTGDLIFISGQVGNLPGTREIVPGGVGPETRQTLENMRVVLAAAGGTRQDVVKCTVFLVDMRDYEAMNEVYAAFFGSSPPARSTVAGSGLALGARVEIECIAAGR
ncbi:MAG TPA: RidA family protein [Longimicrobiales bacterium]|nr:RidA family protein [Longimicrobiales bacterium]